MTKINDLPISVSSVVTLHFYLSTSVPCYPMPHSGFKLLNYKPYTAFSVCCTICCDSELPPYSTVCLFAFQHPSSQLLPQELTEVSILFSQTYMEIHFLMFRYTFINKTAIIGALKTIPYILLFLTPLRTPLKSRYHTGHMVQILVPLSKIGCLITAQTHGCASDNGGLAAQALNVRILHISRDQKPVHNKTSSTLLSFFQRSLLLRQSRTALVLRIFSSFLLQDLLLHPSDPHNESDEDIEYGFLCQKKLRALCISICLVTHCALIFLTHWNACHASNHLPGQTTRFSSRRFREYSCYQGFRRWYAMNEIIISEAKANIIEDSHKLCQRINDSFLLDPTLFDVSLLPVHNQRCCYKGRRRTAAINPPFPPSSKDTADENRGRLLATNPHDPTSRCVISRRSACCSKSRKPGDCQQDNGGIGFQLTHPGAPCGRILLYIEVAVTIRARMMATRRRDRGSEDESAKSNSGGRTGADVEADPAAAPGGTLQRL
ncbi:hypothetical protein T08_8690 [Trichinella sp. T8]|nr:hypothetical protein T08_8690 [Trichinella sp. T8]